MSRDHKEIPATGWFIKNLPNLMTLLNMLSGLTVLYLSIGMGGAKLCRAFLSLDYRCGCGRCF